MRSTFTYHIKTLAASYCLLLATVVCGQSKLPDQVQFERLSIPGTIRSSQVIDIIQDQAGLIWIAGDGLYRYDGLKFKQYKDIEGFEEKLNAHDIHQLLYDGVSHRILLATHKFGLLAYDYGTDRITSLTTNLDFQPIINFLGQGADGKIWAASHNSGLFQLNHDTLKRADVPEINGRPSSLLVHDERIFIGMNGKVQVWRHGKLEQEINISTSSLQLPRYTLPTALFVDGKNQLWIGTEKTGVLVFDLEKETFIKYFSPQDGPFFSRISKIHEDQGGLIWILTKANGVAVYDQQSHQQLHLLRSPFSTKSLSSDNAFCILEDKAGIIWIGTTGDINKYDRTQVKFGQIYHNAMEKLSLSDNMVRSAREINGKVWIGTDGGFINIFDEASKTVAHLKVKVAGDSANYVPMYFLALGDNTVLVATSLGLLEHDLTLKSFKPFAPLWSFTKNRSIRQLAKIDDRLFFIYNGRVHVFDFNTKFVEVLKNGGHKDATNVTHLHVDREKRLWLGSNKGIAEYNYKTRKFRFVDFKHIPAAAEGANMLVLSIEHIGNKLYVGTFNAGLWVFDIRDINKISSPEIYLESKGLPSRTIYSTLPSNDGNVWLSTNNGLIKFEPAISKFITFTVSEGVQEQEFNRLAYCRTKEGKLIFGGINGINYFDPLAIKIEEEDYTPHLLSAYAGNPFIKNNRPVRLVNIQEKFALQFDQNFIDFHFFVPNYEHPKRYAIFYRLENFEKEWKEATSENEVTYANLSPGQYSFQIKTLSLNGKENVRSFDFSIAPPYWKTWWFVVIAILVVAFLMQSIIRGYMQRSQRDRMRLENLLTQRTAEIEKSREELQILNEKKDLIFSILSHDLRSPLTTLKGFLGYLIDHSDELTKEELRRHAINIRNSVSNSLDLIDNTLFWSLSQMGTIQYTPTCFSLYHVLEKLRGLYQLTADKKRIPLTIHCDENLTVCGDENMIYVTLRNLVSNALKFTTEGNPVTITCANADQMVEIKVKDRGIGMSKEYVNRILSMDQPMLKKGTSNEKGTGLGLLLCKNFIEQNKGKLKIDSTENIGTTFTVILPTIAVADENPEVSIQKVNESDPSLEL